LNQPTAADDGIDESRGQRGGEDERKGRKTAV
jgi:hypothetical protein